MLFSLLSIFLTACMNMFRGRATRYKKNFYELPHLFLPLQGLVPHFLPSIWQTCFFCVSGKAAIKVYKVIFSNGCHNATPGHTRSLVTFENAALNGGHISNNLFLPPYAVWPTPGWQLPPLPLPLPPPSPSPPRAVKTVLCMQRTVTKSVWLHPSPPLLAPRR